MENKQKRGRGAPLGSRNALKGTARRVPIHVTVDPDIYQAAIDAAGTERGALTAWIERAIKKELERD